MVNRDYTPAEVGRLHALQRMVAHLETLADGAAVPTEPGEAREYLAAYASTFRQWATRIRSTPGYQP